MLIATPETMWSTPNVTVAMACTRPPRTPPSAPKMTPYQGPQLNAAYAPNQVPRIIMPSRPILTTPARSDQSPPRPAMAIGTAAASAAPMAPLEVRSVASLTTRTNESNSRPAKTTSSHTRQVNRNRTALGDSGGAPTVSPDALMPAPPQARLTALRPIGLC